MVRLVHLNGPPGVGKSIFARSYAADNPKALALDVDVIVSMIGGWRDDFWRTLPIARRLAAAMAREHLANGYDVLLPQLVTNDREIAPYLAAVDDSGATYLEVVLLADLPTTVERFAKRAADEAEPIGRHVEQIVATNGGKQLLAKIRVDLLSYLEGRSQSVTIDTTSLTPAEAYLRVRTVLSER